MRECLGHRVVGKNLKPMENSPNSPADAPPNLGILLDIPINLSVELGSCHLSMQEVLPLGGGSVVQLDKASDAPVDVCVDRKLVGRGEVAASEDRFGISVVDRIV